MDSLDDLAKIAELDKGNILGSIEALPRQVAQAWYEVSGIAEGLPQEFRNVSKIVVSGMGGSALPGRVLRSLMSSSNLAPLDVVTDYKLPNYVRSDTLVILSSYSGNTEETIASAFDAISRGAKLFIITTGGKLSELSKQKNIPSYIFEAKENPSNQPRMALGYAIAANLALLSKLGFVRAEDEEVKQAINEMETNIETSGVRSPASQNPAKIYAKKLKENIPIIISSAHLSGLAHAFKNQINENSKCFALSFDLPELNHHLLEGLKNPAKARGIFHFLFIDSDLYPDEIKRRFPITMNVVEKNEVKADILKLKSPTKLGQVFELLVFSSFVSFYLAMLYGLDPSPIPWVDYFKSELAK